MSRHKTIPPQKRRLIYEKYDGCCAYCGCEIDLKDMQADHIKSVYANSDIHKDMTDEELYDLDNLLPACRQCNFYKSTFDLETFRKRLTDTMMKNLQKEFSYRLALKYGLIEEHIAPVKFYFEELEDWKA